MCVCVCVHVCIYMYVCVCVNVCIQEEKKTFVGSGCCGLGGGMHKNIYPTKHGQQKPYLIRVAALLLH